MRVEIDYEDGRLDVFDTAHLVAGQPFGGACAAFLAWLFRAMFRWFM